MPRVAESVIVGYCDFCVGNRAESRALGSCSFCGALVCRKHAVHVVVYQEVEQARRGWDENSETYDEASRQAYLPSYDARSMACPECASRYTLSILVSKMKVVRPAP